MEHLSRRTTRDVQHLLIVSDQSQRGLVAAQRIADMSRELDIRIEKAHLIVNRVQGELSAETSAFVGKMGIPLLGVIPADEAISTYDLSGRPLVELPDESPVYKSVAGMLKGIV
jgi:CO dehydrogenase maturation factor